VARNNTSNRFSIIKRLNSFRFAFHGIKNLIKHEHNARIHLFALFLAATLGVFFKISLFEWVAMSIVAGMVFLTELLNTAIERLADLVEPKWNDDIRVIKDYCAGAVLVSAVVSIVVGAVIFLPKLIEMFEAYGKSN
jgi:diacylglycerol kinase (ATP)